jgi:hypothetical protein
MILLVLFKFSFQNLEIKQQDDDFTGLVCCLLEDGVGYD